jgi:hypothetical protein
MPQIDPDMGAALVAYLERITEDYRTSWQGREDETVIAEMVEDFSVSLTFEIGIKYAKIISGRKNRSQVHSFVVLSDSRNGFQRGDILKAESWQSPALNFRRGNVFEDNQGANRISWAGF